MKTRSPLREAGSGRPPPLRVPVSPEVEPARLLFDWMPKEARRLLVRQLPDSMEETGRTGLPLIAEAMARGLSLAYDGIAEAQTMPELREQLKRRDWIRDAMDQAHREGIFGEFLDLYEKALLRQSQAAVERELEEIPAAALINMYYSLAENQGLSPDLLLRDRMWVLGQALGIGVLELSRATLRYGMQEGLFPGEDFGLGPLPKAPEGPLGSRPPRDFELVDAFHFLMLRKYQAVPAVVESDWGALHPLVRGFSAHYDQDSWFESQGSRKVEDAVDEVRDFVLWPRH